MSIFHSTTETFFGRHCGFSGLPLDENNCIKPAIIFTSEGPQVCTCKHHGGGDDHLRLCPPLPMCNCFSANESDQLSHCVMNYHVTCGISCRKHNVTHAMVCQVGGLGGLETFNITTHSNWSKTSDTLALHEGMSTCG